MMAFGFFMAFRVRTIQNQYYLRRELKNEGVNYRTTYKLLSNKDYAQIKLVLLDRIPNLRSFVENVDSEQADPIMASQVNSVLLSPVRKDASYLFRVILILLWLAVLSLPFVFIANLDFFVSRYEWWIELIEAR
jgi:hypothetical protein